MIRLQSALLFLLITGTKACTEEELRRIDTWLASQKLNSFGDSEDTMYVGGNPLFDETAGETASRCDYLVSKFSTEPWNIGENDVDIGIVTKPPLDKEENYEILPIGTTGGVNVGEVNNDVESPATKAPKYEIQPTGTGDDGTQTDIADDGDGDGDGDGGDKVVNGLENEVASSASVATSALFLIGTSLVTTFFFN